MNADIQTNRYHLSLLSKKIHYESTYEYSRMCYTLTVAFPYGTKSILIKSSNFSYVGTSCLRIKFRESEHNASKYTVTSTGFLTTILLESISDSFSFESVNFANCIKIKLVSNKYKMIIILIFQCKYNYKQN